MSLARILMMAGDLAATITLARDDVNGWTGYVGPTVAAAAGMATRGSISNDVTPFGTLAWFECESDAAIYITTPAGAAQPALSTLRINGVDHAMEFDYSFDFAGLTYWYFYEPGGSMIGTLSVGATYPWSLS